MERNEYVDSSAISRADDAKRVFVEINGEDVWIPSSQIHESSELRVCATPGKEGTLKVSIWFAIERGLL